MRLGGPIFEQQNDPDTWAAAVTRLGYRAAYCPIGHDASDAVVRAYAAASHEANIVIAEVGAWSNPIATDETVRKDAIAHCKRQLHLADRIGALCCVNIVGSRSEQWDGPHMENFSDETFEMVVDTIREIVDDVKPTTTYWAVETMPWVIPDSPDSYLALLKAIDRDRVGVHLDPVNMISSPRRYCDTTSFLKECFAKLGPYIKSCHAKDVSIGNGLTVHLSEALPGEGALDYAEYLRQVSMLDQDTPIMLEHLATVEEYDRAADNIRRIARASGIAL